MSPSRRDFFKSIAAIGALAVLPETATAAPIDPDDIPFVDDPYTHPNVWTTWNEIDAPAMAKLGEIDSIMFAIIARTRQGEGVDLVLRIQDGFLEMACPNGAWHRFEKRQADLYSLPKWFTRQIGYAAKEADEWGPVRRRVKAEREGSPLL